MQARPVHLVLEGQPAEVVGPLVLLLAPVVARTPLQRRGHYHVWRPHVQLACTSRVMRFESFFLSFVCLLRSVEPQRRPQASQQRESLGVPVLIDSVISACLLYLENFRRWTRTLRLL